jgi:acyl CoA:acetate/3-ketoacid CoA transferase alpha subunit
MGECWSAEFLAASGQLKRAVFSNYMFEGLGRCQAFSRAVQAGQLQTEDYSHYGVASRLLAGALGLPFMPTRVMAGSDLVSISTSDEPKYEFLSCPFSGERLTLVPAAQPDVAIVHGSRADRAGNVQLFGVASLIDEQARAAGAVIATVEEIVEPECIRQAPELTLLPSMIVDAVVEVPFGSHPSGMYQQYDYDHEHMKSYFELSRSQEGVQEYFDQWIFGPEDHWDYLEKVGIARLFELRADPYLGYSLANRQVSK